MYFRSKQHICAILTTASYFWIDYIYIHEWIYNNQHQSWVSFFVTRFLFNHRATSGTSWVSDKGGEFREICSHWFLVCVEESCLLTKQLSVWAPISLVVFGTSGERGGAGGGGGGGGCGFEATAVGITVVSGTGHEQEEQTPLALPFWPFLLDWSSWTFSFTSIDPVIWGRKNMILFTYVRGLKFWETAWSAWKLQNV